MKADDIMELILNKIKTKKNNKSIDKNRELEIELIKIKYVSKPKVLESKLK